MGKYRMGIEAALFFSAALWVAAVSGFAEEVTVPDVPAEESAGEEPAKEEPSMKAAEPSEEEMPSEEVPPSEMDEAMPAAPSEPMVSEKPAERPAEQPMQPRKHIVQPGDTLWSISTAYLIDPFYWPKVWDANRTIKNPDLIYPGNTIFLPSPEALGMLEAPKEPLPVEEEAAEEVEEEPVAKAPEPVPPIPAAPLIAVEAPAKPVLDLALLASVGFVLKGDVNHSGVMVGVKDHKVLMGEGDIAYIKNGKLTPQVGDSLLVYRKIRKVYHPKTGKYLGRLVVVLGTLKVLEAGPKITTTKILKSYNYILAGDSVASYETMRLPSLEETPTGAAAPADGYVVDIKEDKVTIAQFDVVYIDRGVRDGIGRGSSFRVIRTGERTPYFSAGGGVKLPPRIIGELEVITVNDHTATALVRKSSEEINRGDKIQILPAQ